MSKSMSDIERDFLLRIRDAARGVGVALEVRESFGFIVGVMISKMDNQVAWKWDPEHLPDPQLVAAKITAWGRCA